jgi:hypothetical protein
MEVLSANQLISDTERYVVTTPLLKSHAIVDRAVKKIAIFRRLVNLSERSMRLEIYRKTLVIDSVCMPQYSKSTH